MLLCAFTLCSHDGAYKFSDTECTSQNDTMTCTGYNFDYPIDVELLPTSILSVVWSLLIGCTIYQRLERHYINTFSAELVGLLFLFLGWVCGAAFGSLSPGYVQSATYLQFEFQSESYHFTHLEWGPSCWVYFTCRILTATFVLTWVSSIVVLVLFITSFLCASANKAFRAPLHGRRDRRTILRNLTLTQNLP